MRNILSSNEVQMWSASLDVSREASADFSKMLSPDERERAARFVFEVDRRRFVAARGILRTILARYLDQPPQDVAFRYGPNGKPELQVDTRLTFNMSHSHEVMVCAVAYQRQVGVDIEYMKPIPDMAQVAATTFSLAEQSALAALNKHEQLSGFFNCWTRKEAYIKARGDGMSLPLNTFDVTLAPGQPPALLANQLDPDEITHWSFHDLALDEGYKGALVVQGHDVAVKKFLFIP